MLSFVKQPFSTSAALALASIGLAYNADTQTNLPSKEGPLSALELPQAELPQTAQPAVTDLRFNFRDTTLDHVLDYLSKEAGLVINAEVPVEGKLTLLSTVKLNLNQALARLNEELYKQGLGTLLEGRILIVLSYADLQQRVGLVGQGRDPEAILKGPAILTQIIPLSTINAQDLQAIIKDLLPTTAVVSASRGANALVLTSSHTDIRRMLQVVQALDFSVASEYALQICPLRFADAKECAGLLQELFGSVASSVASSAASSGASGQSSQATVDISRFMPNSPVNVGAAALQSEISSEISSESSRVTPTFVVVADEHSNAVVLRGSSELLQTAEAILRELDRDLVGTSELALFPLVNADPLEVADLLLTLFPKDNSSTAESNATQVAGPVGPTVASQPSRRTQEQAELIVVPDERTASVIVRTSSERMPIFFELIGQLDKVPAKKQKVFVFSAEHSDVGQLQTALEGVFGSANSASGASSSQRTSALQNRMNQRSQSGSSSGASSAFGSSGRLGGGIGETPR